MNLVWEEEYIHEPRRIGEPQRYSITEWHLKRVWDKDPMEGKFDVPLRGQWKVSLAYVRRLDERKYEVTINGNNDKTFRSLKAAKAYAVAIVTLEQQHDTIKTFG